MNFYQNDGGLARPVKRNGDIYVNEYERDTTQYDLELERVRRQAYEEEMRKLRMEEQPKPVVNFAPKPPAPTRRVE